MRLVQNVLPGSNTGAARAKRLIMKNVRSGGKCVCVCVCVCYDVCVCVCAPTPYHVLIGGIVLAIANGTAIFNFLLSYTRINVRVVLHCLKSIEFRSQRSDKL